MYKMKKFIGPLLIVLSFIPLAYLLLITFQYGFYGEWREAPTEDLCYFTLETKGVTQPVTLPYVMQDGEAGQLVVLSTQLKDVGSQRLYFKTVFAPVQIYANDKRIFSYGDSGTFPSYLQDPATTSATVELPNEPTIDLKLIYRYPSTRSDLILEPMLVGSYASIFNGLMARQDTHLLLYLVYFVLGIFLLCAGLVIRVFERKGTFFIWLGLIALCCSWWGLGEYDPTTVFIHNAGLVSMLTFGSILYLPAPIFCFFRSTVQYHDSRPMTLCVCVSLFVASLATTMQATSITSFYQMMPYYQWFAIGMFLFGMGYTLREWRVYHNQMAKWFILPWCIIIFSALIKAVQFVSGYSYHFDQYTQYCLLIFVLINGVIGMVLIRNAFDLRERNRLMEQECKMMELQVDNQRRYQSLLMENRQALRQQRHDLHHQLVVIQQLAKEGKLNQLNAHLDTVFSEIPEESIAYCENIAVNALVAHYVGVARSWEITVSIDLIVPNMMGAMNDNSLCVIFGNILENAIEACSRMDSDEKSVVLTSYLRNEMLVIRQYNSAPGNIQCIDGKFVSSKRDEFGIGLTSVQSVAQKYGGNATFTFENNTFHSSIYVPI